MGVYNISGQSLAAAYGISGNALSNAYDKNGTSVYHNQPDYDDFTVEAMFAYAGSNFQSFAVYDDVIAQVQENGRLHIIDISTGSNIKNVTMDMGHGNSCQFSTEFYAQTDEFPLFYIRNSGVWVYRIVGTTSTLIKKYAFSSEIIGTYVAGFGIDSANNRFYTVSYTQGDYISKTGLLRVCVWDMNDETDNGDGTYSFALLNSNDLTWFNQYEAVQGCCFHDGYLFVANGYSGNTQQKIALIDLSSLAITHTVALGTGTELEGCAWVGNEYMIIGQNPSNITYKKVTFAEA